MSTKTIEIDGDTFEIDLDQAKALGLIKQKVVHQIGNIYTLGSVYYMLVCTGESEINLTCLNDGCRLSYYSIQVNNLLFITEEEFNMIITGIDPHIIIKYVGRFNPRTFKV